MKRSIPHAFEPEEIMAYLDGELEAQQAAALASHLEHCSECGVLAIRLRQISERMLDFQAEPSPATLEPPIFAALDSGQATPTPKLQPGTERKRSGLLRGFAWAAGSIAVVVVIGALSLPTLTRSRRGAALVAARETSLSSLDKTRLALPEHKAVADLNGLPDRLDDHATNSFSMNGQPAARSGLRAWNKLQAPPGFEQQAGQIEAPELRGPMIVQTASIMILTINYDQASGAIQRVTAQHGGYIQDMTADTRTGMARSVSATLRVPEKQLETFLADLRQLGHVEQETRNKQEITGQYVDLTARLKTARTTERPYHRAARKPHGKAFRRAGCGA